MLGQGRATTGPLACEQRANPRSMTWEYTDRGSRHLFWDAGVILANMLALAASANLPALVIVGFADKEVEGLLGLHGVGEFRLGLLPVGAGPFNSACLRIGCFVVVPCRSADSVLLLGTYAAFGHAEKSAICG